MTPPPVCRHFHRRLIVSCQALPGESFRDTPSMVRFALAAVEGGAAGIRADSPADVAAIREAVDVPILGKWNQTLDDGSRLITATFEAARALVEAGADMIALAATRRGQRHGALERLARIRSQLGVPVLADIATLDEALAAAAAGADLVLTTMRGHTEDTAHIPGFDLPFLAALVARSPVPVVAEGGLEAPELAAAALRAGAYAVVVGSAITRPVTITRRFAAAVAGAHLPR
ncbi:MAG: putative N-acetylmannosamine-6-phosphate 2-epimerase [Gemmatimonadetes bacterium]|nr:putative N-acetylmannosamine-6-phosphate 2-epimerase [Gemmatimonadota bacterium]